MKYHIITYGCQMNLSDGERLAAVLEKSGYQKTDEIKNANLVAIISCSVRQSAIDRVYGAVRNIRKENKKTKIIITGCLPEKDKKKLAKEADLIFDINQLANLPRMLSRINTNLPDNRAIEQYSNRSVEQYSNYLSIEPRYSTFPIAYVPIMTGCDNFCTYCVVPYTRGPEVSRPASEIIAEIKDLVKMNYKMIILLGQNVNSYHSRINTNMVTNFTNNISEISGKFVKIREITFPWLLKVINDLPGNFWLTFISSHPKDLSDELIETMAQCDRLMSYLHLPVQAGNDEVLCRMNRLYTIAHYKRLIKKIRSKFVQIRDGFERNIAISTDIIVGFPGETKKQFADTTKLMREIKFDMAYIAKYSPRPGTAAWHLPDNVSAKEKEKRWQTLSEILKKTALENNKKYLNKVVEVLITESKGNYLLGQSKNFKNIKITNNQSPITNNQSIGKFVKVKITKVIPWGLEGKMI